MEIIKSREQINKVLKIMQDPANTGYVIRKNFKELEDIVKMGWICVETNEDGIYTSFLYLKLLGLNMYKLGGLSIASKKGATKSMLRLLIGIDDFISNRKINNPEFKVIANSINPVILKLVKQSTNWDIISLHGLKELTGIVDKKIVEEFKVAIDDHNLKFITWK